MISLRTLIFKKQVSIKILHLAIYVSPREHLPFPSLPNKRHPRGQQKDPCCNLIGSLICCRITMGSSKRYLCSPNYQLTGNLANPKKTEILRTENVYTGIIHKIKKLKKSIINEEKFRNLGKNHQLEVLRKIKKFRMDNSNTNIFANMAVRAPGGSLQAAKQELLTK